MDWWLENRLRLVQNNIRETDADLDVDLLVGKLKDLGANCLMLNTGGISAFYPTELAFQKRSPYLKKDLIGETIEKCHQNGIRFIARFDFSKVHESLLQQKPEWMYLSKKGERIYHEGLVSTCVNGGYQQEYIYQLLGEVLDKYPVDGIFFNMFGYTYFDYSGHFYGICHCENCKRRFKEMYGEELPESEDNNNPVYLKYREFQARTVSEMLHNINRFVKQKRPDVAISTYAEYMVDMVRKESNTEIRRPLPFWLNSASENVKSLEDSWDDKVISNCSINAVGLDYRFMGVSKNQIAIRLYESIAEGSGLDFCIIGQFEGYPDRDNLSVVRDVFRFHAQNEKYFGHFKSVAPVALMKPESFLEKEQEMEYLGIFKMLKERHILFDVIKQETIVTRTDPLKQYQMMILPDIRWFTAEQLAVLETLRRGGMKFAATNLSFSSEENSSFLRDVFGAQYIEKAAQLRAAYLETEDKGVFADFADRDWVFLDGSFSKMDFSLADKTYLPLISEGVYGPPEKCGGHSRTEYSGASLRDGSLFFPWRVGTLYYKHGYEDHKKVFLDLLCRELANVPVETDAPANVEVFFSHYTEEDGTAKNYILQLLNLSGFNGMTFFEPTRTQPFVVRLKNAGDPSAAFSLAGKAPVSFTKDGGDICIPIDGLDLYQAIVLQY